MTRIYQVGEPDGRRAHDAYHRFFRCGVWCLEELFRHLAVLLVESKHPGGSVVSLMLDDTTSHNPGSKIVGESWWRDAVRLTATKTVHVSAWIWWLYRLKSRLPGEGNSWPLR